MHTFLVAICLLTNVEGLIRAELDKLGAKFTDIQITAPPVLPMASEHFEITQVTYDPVHLKTYLRLRATDDPRKRSFEAGITGTILFPTLVAARQMELAATARIADFEVAFRPFQALAMINPEDLAGRKTRRRILPGEIVRSEMFSTLSVVEAGRTAKFVIGGEGFSLSMPVLPLEGGALGQTIRVRAPETGRIFKAVVSGPDQVRGESR